MSMYASILDAFNEAAGELGKHLDDSALVDKVLLRLSIEVFACLGWECETRVEEYEELFGNYD